MSLLDLIKEAGVIGAGGAGFPTHAKLASKAEYIILNGAECEPLLRVDQQLMAVYPDEIIKGFHMAGQLVEAEKAVIGIKAKHKDVVELLQSRIEALGLAAAVEIKTLTDTYPMGDEQVLVYEVTGRVVPEAGIPIQVGCVVVNSETALNIYNAAENKAVTEKYITVTGEVPRPITVKVPVGTPIMNVIALSGMNDLTGYAVIDGGPMMGPVMEDVSGHVTKKNKGFIVLKENHPLIRKKSATMDQSRKINRATCEQCRMCTDICPRYLLGHHMEPHKTMRILNYGVEDIEGQKRAQLCCQCNLCELFACPADLFPKAANNYFRDMMLKDGMKYKPTDTRWEPREARGYRQVPSKRLIARLGLRRWDQAAPMVEDTVCPQEIRVSTRQNVGAPSQPIVSLHQKVRAGQMIGQVPDGNLGANIHSSIDGIVTGIEVGYIAIRRK